MKVVALVEGVLMKLGNIPGLTFLHRYVTELHGKETEFYQSIDDYGGYVRSAREAVGDVKQAARGSGKKVETNDDEDEDEDQPDDAFESYMQ